MKTTNPKLWKRLNGLTDEQLQEHLLAFANHDDILPVVKMIIADRKSTKKDHSKK